MPRGYHLSIHHQFPDRLGHGGFTRIELIKDHWWHGPKSVYSYLSFYTMIEGSKEAELREWFIDYAWQLKRGIVLPEE